MFSNSELKTKTYIRVVRVKLGFNGIDFMHLKIMRLQINGQRLREPPNEDTMEVNFEQGNKLKMHIRSSYTTPV